jgi:hypothetical protein
MRPVACAILVAGVAKQTYGPDSGKDRKGIGLGFGANDQAA